MNINTNNVLLLEKQNIQSHEAVTLDENKVVMMNGFKVFRIVEPVCENIENGPTDFIELCHYNIQEDKTDLSPLLDKKYNDYYLVSVDINQYGKFQWTICQLNGGMENAEVFSIKDNRICNDEEIEFLNKLFPEYYEHAYTEEEVLKEK